jgi:hypothetical protein
VSSVCQTFFEDAVFDAGLDGSGGAPVLTAAIETGSGALFPAPLSSQGVRLLESETRASNAGAAVIVRQLGVEVDRLTEVGQRGQPKARQREWGGQYDPMQARAEGGISFGDPVELSPGGQLATIEDLAEHLVAP